MLKVFGFVFLWTHCYAWIRRGCTYANTVHQRSDWELRYCWQRRTIVERRRLSRNTAKSGRSVHWSLRRHYDRTRSQPGRRVQAFDDDLSTRTTSTVPLDCRPTNSSATSRSCRQQSVSLRLIAPHLQCHHTTTNGSSRIWEVDTVWIVSNAVWEMGSH